MASSAIIETNFSKTFDKEEKSWSAYMFITLFTHCMHFKYLTYYIAQIHIFVCMHAPNYNLEKQQIFKGNNIRPFSVQIYHAVRKCAPEFLMFASHSQ